VNPLETAPRASSDDAADRASGGRRFVWHAIAWLLAAIVAWLIFASYRQPDLILDLAGMRLCLQSPLAAPVA
jgi:hypothetical protein